MAVKPRRKREGAMSLSEVATRHEQAADADATSVRPGEELDLVAVDRWLKERVPSLRGAPQVTQYAGGASNWTYRLAYEERDLVLRRPPAGTKAKSAHDMGREYRVQQALKPVYPVVPTMVAHCTDEAVIGCEFYVMERIRGVIPRARMPAGVRLSPQQARSLCLNAIDKLVELHRVDADACGLAALGKGPGYARRQIEGWSKRYDAARTWNVPRFTRVKDWLRDQTPDDVGSCVIHNDYRLDNLVLDSADPTQVVGVLDWEMATIGDPLMDLGNSMAYWIEASDSPMMRALRRQPTHLPGMLKREEIVEYYCDRMDLAPDNWVFYEVYGLFRLSVIIQQIYYRYFHRQTQSKAFKHYWIVLHYFDLRCQQLIRRGGS
jgi:aminoglycoside phosphotransferase (APT) family kinase protein